MNNTIPSLFFKISEENPDLPAQWSKDKDGKFHKTTYNGLKKEVIRVATFLSRKLNVKKYDNVLLLSDNRKEWLISDLALLSLGAVDVPRGRDSTAEEIAFILNAVKAKVIIVENDILLQKLFKYPENLKTVESIIYFDTPETEVPFTLIPFSTLLNEEGDEKIFNIEKIREDDLATIIFTSGTTGKPKGVMISHHNLYFQLERVHHVAPFEKGQIWLSVLPVWHAFERILQYVALYEIESIAYSKPIGKIMLTDITRINPHYIGSVPRIWETIKEGVEQSLKSKSKLERFLFNSFLKFSKIYHKHKKIIKGLNTSYDRKPISKFFSLFPFLFLAPFWLFGKKLVFSQVRNKLGKNYVGGISGGGSLSPDIEEYFEALGILLLNGYGLTETSPVIGTGLFWGSKKGYMKTLRDTEIKIVSDDEKPLPYGKKGELLVKGDQIMKGYWENKELTKTIIDKDGYLRTGDLAIMYDDSWFKIVGRKKDTIVLRGGENIEPLPIENKLILSELIINAVVVGQDQKYLSALIVPNYKNIELYLKNNGINYLSRDSLSEMEEVKALLLRETTKLINAKNGFKSFEEIIKIKLLKTPFEVGKELSLKQELKRNEVNRIYEKEIEALYK